MSAVPRPNPKPATPPRGLRAYRPLRPFRLRLIDAVSLSAAGLLLLKLIAVLGEAAPGASLPGAPLPEFARSLASVRQGYEPPDPATTGSVTPSTKAEAKPQAGADARPDDPPVYQPERLEAVSPTERALLEKLAARREALRQRSDALDMREKLIGEAERKLETGVADLREAEEKGDLGGAKKAEAERAGLRPIVTMYETMKPKDAARVFDRLSLDVLVPLVLAMNPRKMAEILAVMAPEPAEKLTIALAHRARGLDAPAPPQAAALPAGELPALDPGPPTRPPMP